MPPPAELLSLIERFDRYRDDYRKGAFNETQLRIDYLNPLFRLLGWDMDNRNGLSEAFREVIHEYSLKTLDGSKAPDYGFRIGKQLKFFLEAKKPSVKIKEDQTPAFQLRSYAWNAKLPLSILSDFEEFAIYDCRFMPDRLDRATVARLDYFTFEELPQRWDSFAAIFSKEAIENGSFDKYAETTKARRGTIDVDDAFLAEIEQWREWLAVDIAKRNKTLTAGELNDAVQRTIDRIIFLRIAEDRGIEDYGRLQALANGEQVYPGLVQLFHQADARYNSGLFHFRKEKGQVEEPDELTTELEINDKPLKEIFRRIYYPSPYRFMVMPASVLGQVYEQFLGKVITLDARHRVTVELKPEVRKAGGVYYTPEYIARYIVQNTIGRLVEGKTPKEVANLRFLDPACGSGSFLLVAYDFLLDWYLNWYTTNEPEKRTKGKNPALFATEGGWRLTTAEKRRILLNNIHGVDIDRQAVEVTKLSLLLKVLEGENEETFGRQLTLVHERVLPDLGANIKNGNSLIGSDFYDESTNAELDIQTRRRINAFDWEREFPEIMKMRGFDAVIGNPPYIRVRGFKELFPEQVDYLETTYSCATHVWDVYLLIFERGLQLIKEGGKIGFILPIQTLHQPNNESLRRILVDETTIDIVADLSKLSVFTGALVKNCILICTKGKVGDATIHTLLPLSSDDLLRSSGGTWKQSQVRDNPGFSLKLDLLSPTRYLVERLQEQSWRLEQLCYVTFGMRSSARGKGQGGKERLITYDPQMPQAKPYLEGRDIRRYAMSQTDRFIRYIPSEMYSPRSPELFESAKIVSQSMLSRKQLVATLDTSGYYVEQSLVCIIPHGIMTPPVEMSVPLEFLLAVINSRFQSFYFGNFIIDHSLGGGLIHATPGPQGKLLVPKEVSRFVKPVVAHVQRIISLNKEKDAAKSAHDRSFLQRQIDQTDRQIDRLVYELYGLTEEEVAIIEGDAK